MNDTPTPRTNAAAFTVQDAQNEGMRPDRQIVDAFLSRTIEKELAAVTEHRDRLADAHKLIATQLLYDELNEDQIEHADWETAYDEMIKISREALQSLNQPTEQ